MASDMNKNRDIAIAHKDYDTFGGGERVAEALAEMFDAPLIVGRDDRDGEFDTQQIDYSPLPDSVAKAMIDRGGATRSLAYQLCWQQQAKLTEYDVVITTGNEPLWYVPEDHQTVIAYTHSTPRWQYDLFHDIDGFLGQGYQLASRVIYQHNVPRVDAWIANSDRVARRITQYWPVDEDDVRIVYPPVDVERYDPGIEPTRDYYLYLGRLPEHKRVHLLIEAFRDLDHDLVIAGTGPEAERLRRMAPDNVHFVGWVDEDEKPRWYSGAKALLYPAQNEDFGMVPIEALASGTPVIGVNEGFTRYQVMEGRNGYLCEASPQGFRRGIQQFESNGVAWSPDRLADFAEHFDRDQFRNGVREAVADAEAETQISPAWQAPRAATDGGDPK
jgi:glycosyltransferase involved in cell wall biosynthesis